MLSNEVTAFILFFQQFGLAIAGGACLWGLFFSINAENTEEEGRKKIFKDITKKLFIPFFFGFVLSTFIWLFRGFTRTSLGSAPIFRVLSDISSVSHYVSTGIPILWIVFILLSVSACIVYFLKHDYFSRFSHTYYLLSFIIVFILISFPTGLQAFDAGQFFFIKHGFPLIFTVGTVTIVDCIFFFTRGSLRAKRQIFPYLTTLYKLVWIGLGIDFLADWLTGAPIILSGQFFFVQTVVAIIIINSTLFTGPLTEALISGVSEKRVKPLEKRWGIISGISGVISFSSWTTLTITAFFTDIPFSFSTLMYFYIIKLVIVYAIYQVLEHLTDIPVSFVNTN